MEAHFVSFMKYLKHKNKYTGVQIRDVVKKHMMGDAPSKISFASIGERYCRADDAGKKTIEKYLADIVEAAKTPESIDKLKTVMENPMVFVQNNFGLMAIVQKHMTSPELKELAMGIVKKYQLDSHSTDRDKVIETTRAFVNSEDFPVVFDHLHKMFLVMQENLKL